MSETPVDQLTREAAEAELARLADLLARAVNWQLANNRDWLAHTKTRGEINRTKKKHGPQKKSGNARHGARSSNIFVGGGAVFGPRNRTTTNSLPHTGSVNS